jgi:hypothetical protein
MAHTFEFAQQVVRDSTIILQDNLTAANLCQRNVEEAFAEKKGKTVTVKTIPDLGAANIFDDTADTSETDITEPTVDIVLERHFYQKIKLSSDQKKFEVDDFVLQVAGPCALSIAESVDSYFIDRFAAGFARNLAGTAGNSPSTVAHILAGRKLIKDGRGTYKNVASIIDTTAENSFLQITQFTNADYGTERPIAFREASLGRAHGASYFASQNAGTLDRGDIAGTVLIDGDPGTTTTIHMDAFTAASGTVKEGTRFTIAGDTSSTVYTVTADATIASNEADLIVTPAADASIADNAAVTFQAALAENILYNINAAYGAIVAPEPFEGVPSAIQVMDGLSMRASFFSDHLRMKDYFLLDVYAGSKVVHPQSGSVING